MALFLCLGASAQQSNPIVLLDDSTLSIDPTAPGPWEIDVVNLGTETLTATVSLSGVEGISAPGRVTLSRQRVTTFEISVASGQTPSGEGELTIVVPGGLVTRTIEVTEPAATAPLLPSSIDRGVGMDPFADDSESLVQELPGTEAPDTTSEECAAAGVGGSALVGRLSGPSENTGLACLQGSTLRVVGLDHTGTWSGKVDVIPGADGGEIAVTVKVKQTPWLPLVAMVVMLGVTTFIGTWLIGRMQRRSEIRYTLAKLEASVRARYLEVVERLQTTLPSLPVAGTARFSMDGTTLWLTEVVNDANAAYDAAETEDERTKAAEMKEVIDAIDAIRALHLAIEQAAGVIARIIASTDATIDVSTSPIVQRIPLAEQPIADKAEAENLQTAVTEALEDLRTMAGAFDIVQTLPANKQGFTTKLLTAQHGTLEAVVKAVKDEAAKRLAAGAVKETVTDEEEEGVTPEVETPETGDTASGPIRFLRSTIEQVAEKAATAGQRLTPSGVGLLGGFVLGVVAGGLFVNGWWLAALVPTALALVLLWIAVRRTIRDHRALPNVDQLRWRLKAVNYSIAAVGAGVVLASGIATLYVANATFGWSDYWGLVGWAFGFGSAVTITKSLVPRLSTG